MNVTEWDMWLAMGMYCTLSEVFSLEITQFWSFTLKHTILKTYFIKLMFPCLINFPFTPLMQVLAENIVVKIVGRCVRTLHVTDMCLGFV